MVLHGEPDILHCKVKWALGNINRNKESGGNGIPAELFKILKDAAVQVLLSIGQQIWKIQQWTEFQNFHWTGKGQFSFQSQRKAMLKNIQTITKLHSFHILAKSMKSVNHLVVSDSLRPRGL